MFNEMLYFVDVKAMFEKYLAYLRPKTGFVMISLFKFLHLKNGRSNKSDRSQENILEIVKGVFTIVNEVQVVGNTLDGTAGWTIYMLRPIGKQH